jgi:DNA mismatch repair ATPase MutS
MSAMHRSELYKAIAQRLGTVAQGKSTFALFEDGREKLALLDRIMKAVKRNTGGDPARDVNYLAQVISKVKRIRAEVASMVFDDPAWEGDPREAKLAAQFENDKKKWLAKFDSSLLLLDNMGQDAMRRAKKSRK